MAAQDAVTTNSRKTHHKKLEKLINQGRHSSYTASLHQLPETVRPPGPGDPLGRGESMIFANARYRSLQSAGATARFRARPSDSLRVIPTAEFVGIGRRFFRIEEHVAVRCLCWDAVGLGHPTRTHLSQSWGSGEPAPTTFPRDLPYVEARRSGLKFHTNWKAASRSLRKGTCRWASSSGEEVVETLSEPRV